MAPRHAERRFPEKKPQSLPAPRFWRRDSCFNLVPRLRPAKHPAAWGRFLSLLAVLSWEFVRFGLLFPHCVPKLSLRLFESVSGFFLASSRHAATLLRLFRTPSSCSEMKSLLYGPGSHRPSLGFPDNISLYVEGVKEACDPTPLPPTT